jgi:hypothetical protein
LLPEAVNGLTTNVTICNSYQTIASDDFESGDWTGGTGWLDDWTSSGDAGVVTNGAPYDGNYHLRLRTDDGHASRSVDLSKEVNIHLRLWAKVNSMENTETATCDISSNGVDWTTVHTWSNADDDNTYHYYDIDLSSYALSSRFWIAFNAHMSGTGDHFYVDDLEVVWVASDPETIASDDFESGDWTGGTGWLDDWTSYGDAGVVTNAAPHQGNYHLRLRTGYGNATRSVDLAGNVVVNILLWAKVNSFEAGETATCDISSDNITWTTVYTWTNADDDNTYHYYEIDLSSYDLTSQFWIAFNAHMSGTGDYFYVDDLEVVSMNGFGITALAGDRVVKAVVDIGGGMTVLSWYLK